MTRPTNTQFAVAVHALTLLASEPGRARSSPDMAISVRANPVYLRRVLARLAAAGTVSSRPGPNGGWQLGRDPRDIRLGEVWRAVNAGEQVFGRHAPNPDCPVGCRMTAVLNELDERAVTALSTELDHTSLADLAGPPPPG